MINLITKVDLHIHTTCSDGEYSVEEVLQKAHRLKLDYVGIVDHDTIDNFKEVDSSALATMLKRGGTRIWVGTEFSVKLGNVKMHIIGYNFNPSHFAISNIIEKQQELREEDLMVKIKHLENQGFHLKEEQIEKLKTIKNVGKPHIAKALQENGVNESIDDIIKKYLNTCKNNLRVEAKEVIDAVHKAGGLIVIAHPYQITWENKISEEEAKKVWEELVKLGADGMECFYSSYTLNDAKKLINFANEHNLLITMGSDFHGEHVKPEIKFGQIMR